MSGALTGTNMHAFMPGLRAGQRMHILVSSCNTTIITDVIVPDFLPPAYTAIEQTRHSFGTDTEVRQLAPRLQLKRFHQRSACKRTPRECRWSSPS